MKILTSFAGRELTDNDLQLVRGGESNDLLSLELERGWGRDRDRERGGERRREGERWGNYDGEYYGYYREWRGDDYSGDC
jgi:hypothetical protein